MVGHPPSFEGRLDGETNIERDEALLRVGGLAGRVAALRGPLVSLGVGQTLHDPVAVRARGAGIPVVRRHSGGSGLYHVDGDLAWTIVLPRTDARVGRDYTHAYDRLGAPLVGFLREFGLHAAWATPFDLSNSYCLFGGRGRVLTVDGRAVGGAAQHASAHAVLHHGILNLSVDRSRVSELFDIPRQLLNEKLTSLRELGIDLTLEALGRRIATRLDGFLRGAPEAFLLT
jgi:lipoate-protein ligase A